MQPYDSRGKAGTSTAAINAGNSATVFKKAAAEQGAASRDPSVNAGVSSAVNSVGTLDTAGQKDPTAMEQKTAHGEMINKTLSS